MDDHLDAFDDLLGTGLDPVDAVPEADFGTDAFDAHAGLQPLDDMTLDVHDTGPNGLDAGIQDFPLEDDPVAPADVAPASAADDDDPWSAAFLS